MRLEAGGAGQGQVDQAPDPIFPQTWEMGSRTGRGAPSGSGHCPAQPRPTDYDG